MGVGRRSGATTKTLEGGVTISKEAWAEVMVLMEESFETMSRGRGQCSSGYPLRPLDIERPLVVLFAINDETLFWGICI
jgi:hypothetical protein